MKDNSLRSKPWNRNKFHGGSNGKQNNLNDNQLNALITSLKNIRSKREENFNSFVAKLKFQSKVATVSDEKCRGAYVDLGAAHHFFHSRSSFITYQRIEPESVKAASSTSKLVGKVTIILPFNNGTTIEAYRAPEFSANIIYQFDFYSRHAK